MVAAISQAENDKLDFIVSPVRYGQDNAHGGVRLHVRLLGMGYSHQGEIGEDLPENAKPPRHQMQPQGQIGPTGRFVWQR